MCNTSIFAGNFTGDADAFGGLRARCESAHDVIANGGDVLVRALGFLLLLDGRDDSPGSASGSDYVLVGNRQKISLVNGQLAAHLVQVRSL